MNKETSETIRVRSISIGFALLALAVFKPFGLETWQWEICLHLLGLGLLGLIGCTLSEMCLKYVIGMPRSTQFGVDYIIRRNLWFQFINTPLISLMICLYRHFVLSSRIEDNLFSWGNYLETLIIMAFCSFVIGIYWRYKFRSRYMEAELEEMRQLNEQLSKLQTSDAPVKTPESIVLTGSTSETVTLSVSNLLYIEAVGNYVKIHQCRNEQLHSDMLRATTKQMEERLQGYGNIVRCHRAFLVNIRNINQIVSKSGSMHLRINHTDECIPVSRRNMSQIAEAVKNLRI